MKNIYISEEEFKNRYPELSLIRYKFCVNALKYEDVKFGHMGRYIHRPLPLTDDLKKCFSLDCGGLLIETMKDTEIYTEDAEMYNYHKRPDGSSLIKHTKNVAIMLSKSEAKPGDLLVMKDTDNATHYAIFLGKFVLGDVDGDYIIHAFASERKVVIHRFSGELFKDTISAFTLKTMLNYEEKEQKGESL